MQSEDSDVLFERGRVLEANGRRGEAEVCWRTIAESHIGGALGMAWIAIQSGDDDQESYWTTRAAELGNVGSMHSVGRILSQGGNTTDAEKWWLKAAEEGNSDSMCSLAFMYRRSSRLAEYRCWIDRAAHAKHPFAMFALGTYNENSGDLNAARKWLELSWKAGYNLAARHLIRIAKAQGDAAYVQQISEALSKSDTTI